MGALLAAGAGAGEGLNELFTRLLTQDKLAEEMRSNRAGEGLRGKEIDVQGRNVDSEAALRAAQTGKIGTDAADAAKEAAAADALAHDPSTPAQQQQFLKLRGSVKGTIPASLFPAPAKPPTPAIRDTKDGLSLIDLSTGVGKPIVSPAGSTLQGFHQTSADSSQALQTDAGFVSWDPKNPGAGTKPIIGTGGGQAQPKAPAQVVARTDMAGKIGSHINDLQGELDEAEKRGLLGPVGGRVSDFLSKEWGSTGNPDNDELMNSLRFDLSALRTGFASLHGRGGANSGIANDLKTNLEAAPMSHAGISGAVKAAKKWIDGYAAGPGAGKGSAAGSAPSGAPPGPGAQTGQAGAGSGDAYQMYLDSLKPKGKP